MLFVAAVLIRGAWVPTWSRLRFEGHETLYLAAFQGAEVSASTRAYPLLTWFYGALGVLSSDPKWMVFCAIIAGGVAVVGAAEWVGRWVSPMAGLWTGVLVALLPEHAAWSTSTYNVILPHALLIWAFALGGWRAFWLIALAACLRLEVGLAAVALGWPAIGALLGLFWDLDIPHISDPSLAFEMNLPMVRFLGPSVLFLGLFGLFKRKAWALFAVVIWVHLVSAPFDDYGARHGLLGSVALCGMVASLARPTRHLLPLVVAFGLNWDLVDLRTNWQGDEAPVGADLAVAAEALPPLPESCTVVLDEPPIVGQTQPSHFAFYAGALRGECVVWGEEFWHRRWSSRGLGDRALRMRTLYHLSPVAAARPEGGGPVRIYHRLERRW